LTFRKFDTGTWGDPWVENLEPLEKLLFIFLWTNDRCNQSGVYEITDKRIQAECIKPTVKMFKALSERIYRSGNIVWIKSFFKHQCQNESFAKKALASISDFPHEIQHGFIILNQSVFDKYDVEYNIEIPESCKPILPFQKDQIREEQNREDKNCGTTTEHSGNSKLHGGDMVSKTRQATEKKKKYGKYVLLTDNEYLKLCKDYGSLAINSKIEDINNYCGSHGKKYKDYAATIRAWLKKDNVKKIIFGWQCMDCGIMGKGEPPKKCHHCDYDSFKTGNLKPDWEQRNKESFTGEYANNEKAQAVKKMLNPEE
jgi:hypothetical protein